MKKGVPFWIKITERRIIRFEVTDEATLLLCFKKEKVKMEVMKMKKMKWAFVLLSFMIVMSYSTGAFASEKSMAKKDIVDTAIGAGDFTILTSALEKAGLVKTLKGKGPYTVFAPTDEAFEKLINQLGITKEQLLDRKDLKTILLYHVVKGKVLASDLKAGKVKTLAKKKIKISLNPVRVNNATVVMQDIETSNGVIHVIDQVLVPAK